MYFNFCMCVPLRAMVRGKGGHARIAFTKLRLPIVWSTGECRNRCRLPQAVNILVYARKGIQIALVHNVTFLIVDEKSK